MIGNGIHSSTSRHSPNHDIQNVECNNKNYTTN